VISRRRKPSARTSGAFLRIRNPTTGETDTWPLPAANWSGRGSPPGAGGWTYNDPGQVDGPCLRVQIKEKWKKREAIKATCRGDQIAFSLDEASQGSLEVSFLAASGDRMFCTLFGGDVSRDLPATGGATGIFRAKGAPAPAGCS
jgi:hypothetical protein